MKERPILFSAPMVRAILDGSKTQTRRVMKTQLIYGDVCGLFPSWYLPTGPESGILYPNGKEQVLAMCPYGQPGDRLSVPDADGLLLEIVDVRVERLREMSREDACAEGVESVVQSGVDSATKPCFRDYLNRVPNYYSPIDSFASLWESIYGADTWEANPWVWVVEFKRVDAQPSKT